MKKITLILGIVVSILMSSCVSFYPMETEVPLISKKNDLRVAVGISNIPTAQASVSYGLTDKIAVQVIGIAGMDYSYYFQVAPGYYKNLGNNQILELYGGFGYGYGDAYMDANPGNLYGNYQLYFGQANFGKIASKTSNLEIGLGIKGGYLYSNLTDENYYRDNPTFPYIVKTCNDESILVEPVGFLRIGGKKLKFKVKVGTTMIYKLTNTKQNLPFSHLKLGVGLDYRL